jgi:hypothetical protein
MTAQQDVSPAEALARLKLYRYPVSIALGALVIDIVARAVSTFDMEFVHAFEGALFPVAAIALLAASRIDQRVSDTVFRVDVWLALALALGGLRSALWAAGLNPFESNGVTFLLGVIAAPITFFLLRRRSSPSRSTPETIPQKSRKESQTEELGINKTQQSRSAKL